MFTNSSKETKLNINKTANSKCTLVVLKIILGMGQIIFNTPRIIIDNSIECFVLIVKSIEAVFIQFG